MKIVFLETNSLGEDISLSKFEDLGEVITYESTAEESVLERVRDADIVVVNKVLMNASALEGAEHVKMIAVTATGTNNIDWEYVERKGIVVTNVAGYSTDAVAQHTFALLFYILHRLNYYDRYVKEGGYFDSPCFSHFEERFFELRGKTWGIVGLGAIGRQVAGIAAAFGCQVVYYSTTGKNADREYVRVDWDTLLGESDIISLHAPLTEATEGMMNLEAFQKMKHSAILINVARGALVVEEDLAKALEEGMIAGAGADVLSVEPMRKDNPLFRIQDSGKLIITPHIGWAPKETRERLMEEVYQNIKAFQRGEKRNVVLVQCC